MILYALLFLRTSPEAKHTNGLMGTNSITPSPFASNLWSKPRNSNVMMDSVESSPGMPVES
jgi:hypothetical protein